MGLLGGIFGGGDDPAKDAQDAEKKRQKDIKKGLVGIDQAFAGYDPDFYGGVKTDAINYYLPQLQDQFQKAGSRMNFALTRQGLTDSSAADKNLTDLEAAFATGRADVTNKALQQVQSVKANVQDQKNQITQALYSSANPDLAATQANAAAASLKSTPLVDKLAPAFDKVATGLGTAFSYNPRLNPYYSRIQAATGSESSQRIVA